MSAINRQAMCMAQILNKCSKCGRPLEVMETGYYHLNSRTDRFDLECKHCFDLEASKPVGFA